MAFFQIEYSSDVLGQYRQVDVIYPDRDQIAERESDTDIPVLYLLHGMGGNHNSWAFRTNIQRLLRKTNLIVIMPNSEKVCKRSLSHCLRLLQYWDFWYLC